MNESRRKNDEAEASLFSVSTHFISYLFCISSLFKHILHCFAFLLCLVYFCHIFYCFTLLFILLISSCLTSPPLFLLVVFSYIASYPLFYIAIQASAPVTIYVFQFCSCSCSSSTLMEKETFLQNILPFLCFMMSYEAFCVIFVVFPPDCYKFYFNFISY